MLEEEYPIHPTLDRLIQGFKKFSTVGFPRGIPLPATDWRLLLQYLTKYEAAVVPQVSEYLCGNKADLSLLECPEDLKQTMQSFKVSSVAVSDFLNQLLEYRHQIETLFFALQDCVAELGNPCQKFKNASAEAFLLSKKK